MRSPVGIEQADALEQDVHREAGIAEWQSDVEGLVAVYDTLVSVPHPTSLVYTTERLQVFASVLICGDVPGLQHCGVAAYRHHRIAFRRQ